MSHSGDYSSDSVSSTENLTSDQHDGGLLSSFERRMASVNPNDIPDDINVYNSRVHSLHRLGCSSTHGSKLKQLFEARTGGTAGRTLKKSGQAGLVLERHADLIVSKMEQDEALMEDSPTSEQLRRTTLRDMPQCLTIKKQVKVKLSKSVSKKSKRRPLSCYKMLKYRISIAVDKLKVNLKDLMYSLELWYTPLKRIEGNFGTGVTSFFKFLRCLFLVNVVIAILTLSFIVIPQVSHWSAGSHSAFGWSNIADLFTGEGYLSNTALFFGFYTNHTIQTIPLLSYSMSHAYFFTVVVVYLGSFVFFGVSAARSYRRSFIETEGGLKNVYANKVFCGWEYNIATNDAAVLKSKAIYNELKELLSEFAYNRPKETFYSKFLTRTVQIFANILIVGLLIGIGCLLWYLMKKIATDKSDLVVIIPLFVNVIMTLMPMLFSFIVRYEGYKNPKVMLNLTLVRTFILGASTIGVLVSFWIKNSLHIECWETSLGQEIYRMMIFDFFISVLCAAVFDAILFGVYKFTKSNHLEFDIARNTMQIIYNQTLFWVGLVFSPLLPVVVVIKLFLTWYIRELIVLHLCQPSAKSWKAAQNSTWFLVMTFLSLLLVGGLLGYIMSYIQVSSSCGPFIRYNFMYEIVTEDVFNLRQNSTVWSVILYTTKPGVIALILIFMCARVYYLRAKAEAQKGIVEQYRNLLAWSAKDKEFWINNISLITNGQWQYELYDHKNVDPSLQQPDFNGELGNMHKGPLSPNRIISSLSVVDSERPSSSTMSFDLESNGLNSKYKKYL